MLTTKFNMVLALIGLFILLWVLLLTLAIWPHGVYFLSPQELYISLCFLDLCKVIKRGMNRQMLVEFVTIHRLKDLALI